MTRILYKSTNKNVEWNSSKKCYDCIYAEYTEEYTRLWKNITWVCHRDEIIDGCFVRNPDEGLEKIIQSQNVDDILRDSAVVFSVPVEDLYKTITRMKKEMEQWQKDNERMEAEIINILKGNYE